MNNRPTTRGAMGGTVVSLVRRHAPAVRVFLLALCLTAGPSCSSRDPARELRRVAPAITADDVELLLSDDATFESRCAEIGHTRLKRTLGRLSGSPTELSPDALLDWHEVAGPHFERLSREMARIHGKRSYLQEMELQQRLGLTRWQAHRRLMVRMQSALRNSDLPVQGKYAVSERLRRWAADVGDSSAVTRQLMDEAGWARRAPNATREDAYSRAHRAARFALTAGHRELAVQTLGELGFFFDAVEDPDSVRYYFDWSYREARDARLPYYQARILGHLGNMYAARGRLAIAHRLHEQAHETLDGSPNPADGLRYVVEAMEFYATRGSYQAVNRLYAKAKQLQRSSGGPEAEQLGYRLEGLRAGYLQHQGRIDEAIELLSQTERAFRESGGGPHAGWMTLNFAHLLARVHRLDEAEEVLLRGQAEAEEKGWADISAQYSLSLANVYLERHESRMAREHLHRFDEFGRRIPAHWHHVWIVRGLSEVRCDLEEGDELAAARHLAWVLERIENVLEETEASAMAYLQIDAYGWVREVIHEAILDRPDLTYDVEMAWRELAPRMGSAKRAPRRPATSWTDFRPLTSTGPGTGPETVAELVEDWTRRLLGTRAARSSGLPGDARHLVYRVGDDVILRWLRDGQEIRADTVSIPPDSVRHVLHRSLAALSEGAKTPDAPIEPELAESLRTLARALLPPDPSPDPLFVSPGGFLAEVPFPVLNVADQGYRALIEDRDVGRLRRLGFRNGRRGSRTLVVCSEVDPSLRREYPGVVNLEVGREEAIRVASRFPSSLLLEGRDATKARILAEWRRAPVLWIVSHVVRDPEAPFVTFIPVANGYDAGAKEDAQIDVLDIRTADFSGCELVVLSACASGAPYVDATQTSASLGTAFLDAGAEATVQTLWRITDADAAAFSEEFLDRLRTEDGEPVAALAEVQRAWIRAGRHPSVWGAFDARVTQVEARLGTLPASASP